MSNFYTLITGASEGFGRALAIECASRKMNLILVALPDSNLHFLAEPQRGGLRLPGADGAASGDCRRDSIR